MLECAPLFLEKLLLANFLAPLLVCFNLWDCLLMEKNGSFLKAKTVTIKGIPEEEAWALCKPFIALKWSFDYLF